MIKQLRNWFRGHPLDNPAIDIRKPEVWNSIFGDGTTTDAGRNVNHNSILEYAPVFQSVSVISGDLAKLPLNIYRRRRDISADAREVDRSHPTFQMIRYKANAETSAFKLFRRLATHALLYGNGYCLIVRDGQGRPVELVNLLPDRTGTERQKVGDKIELVYTSEISGRVLVFPASDIFHLEGPNSSDIGNADFLSKIRNAAALGLAQEKFASSFFKNGARVGGVLQIPTTFTQTAKENLQEGFDKTYSGADSWYKTVILREGATFNRLTSPPSEGQLSQGSEQSVRQIARFFSLPPSKLGLSDSVSYNSKSEDNQAYLDQTLGTWLAAITSEAWLKLLTPAEQAADSHYFEHNTNAMLRLDSLKRFQNYAIAIRNGILSPNEVRARENILPREGGDSYSVEATGGSNDQQFDNDGPRNDTRRVIYSATNRARHKAKNPPAFCEWVDGDLVSHRRQANELDLSPDILNGLCEALRSVTDSTTAEDLPAAVDKICKDIENQHG